MDFRIVTNDRTMSETSTRESLESLLRPAVVSASENTDVLAVGFDALHLDALVAVLSEIESPPRVCVLTDRTVLRNLRQRFTAASRAAEVVESDALALRTFATDDPPALERNLLLTDERALVMLVAAESAGTLTPDSNDEAFVEGLYERFRDAFEASEPFDLRTPRWERISGTLTETFGPEVEATFSELVGDEIDGTDGTGGTDETGSTERVAEPVRAAVLAAASHRETLYDISNWGEEVGLASRATFSRMKRHLEGEGLVDTEKVPIDIGRPRLRLMRTDRALAA
jgi:hypothetical protein